MRSRTYVEGSPAGRALHARVTAPFRRHAAAPPLPLRPLFQRMDASKRGYGAQRLEARREKRLREAKWRFCNEKSFFFFFFPECFDKLRREALFLYSTDPTEEFGEEGLLTQNSFYPLPKKKKKTLYKSGFKVGLGMSS